ncbi:hypothetical protein [Streptomyces radicis]|nr:hypothetical protein [Streptomyces radicis]
MALAAARHAHAALGDVHGLPLATDGARRHLERPEALDKSLIIAAFAEDTANSRRFSDLLAEADPLITAWLGTHAERTEDRDALLSSGGPFPDWETTPHAWGAEGVTCGFMASGGARESDISRGHPGGGDVFHLYHGDVAACSLRLMYRGGSPV